MVDLYAIFNRSQEILKLKSVTNGSVTLINLHIHYTNKKYFCSLLLKQSNKLLNTLKQRFPSAEMFPLAVMRTRSYLRNVMSFMRY